MKTCFRMIVKGMLMSLATVFWGWAQIDSVLPLDMPAVPVVMQAEIRLNDGTMVNGTVVHHYDSLIIIKTALMGEITIKKENIKSVCESRTGNVLARDSAGVETVTVEPQLAWPKGPGGHSLLFMPTAFVQPRHSIYFTDRELMFMNIDFSPVRRVSFSAGCIFPVVADFQMITLGAKCQFIESATGSGTVAFAATGSAALPTFADVPYWTAGCVMSYRSITGRLGVHGALGIQGTNNSQFDLLYQGPSRPEWDRNLFYAVGTEGQVTGWSKLIFELFNYAPFQESAGINYLSFGFRMSGGRLSADIGGIKPLNVYAGGLFILIPYVSVTCQIR